MSADDLALAPAPPAMDVSVESLQEYCSNVNSNDLDLQLRGTRQLRRLLSLENAPVQNVIDSGILPRLVQFLSDSDTSSPQLQFEAAWALTNVASGTSEQTQSIIDAGTVPIFIRLFSSPNSDVVEQSVWAIGNIGGDSVRNRDLVLNEGAMPALLKLCDSFTDSTAITLPRNVAWALSNCCRGKPSPDFAVAQAALPALRNMLQSQDLEAAIDAAWALSYLADGPNEQIQAVLDTGVAPHLVALLNNQDAHVQTPVLRCIGNIVGGSDAQKQCILDLNFLPALRQLLPENARRAMRLEMCVVVRKITGGSKAQVQAVFNADIFPSLIEFLKNEGDAEMKRTIVTALSQAAPHGNGEQILSLVRSGVFPPLIELLEDAATVSVLNRLTCLDNIFKGAVSAGDNVSNITFEAICDCGGVAVIEGLMDHEDVTIQQRALEVQTTLEELKNQLATSYILK